MARFWLPALFGCWLLAGAGCAGRTLAGEWQGELPLRGAESCRIRFDDSDRFDFACRGALNGSGRFALEGEELTLEWTRLSAQGARVRPPNGVLRFLLSGGGNELRMRPEGGGADLVWRRDFR